MQCPNCSATTTLDSNFCPACGCSLQQNTAASNPATEHVNSKTDASGRDYGFVSQNIEQYNSYCNHPYSPTGTPINSPGASHRNGNAYDYNQRDTPAYSLHQIPNQQTSSQSTQFYASSVQSGNNHSAQAKTTPIKPLIITLIIALVIAILITAYFLITRQIPFNSTSKTTTSSNAFEPVEVDLPAEITSYFSTPDIQFSNDGTKCYIYGEGIDQPGLFLILDTATNTITDTIELETIPLDAVQSSDSSRIAIVAAERDINIEDEIEDDYYLTFIDVDSKTTKNVYLGQGVDAYYEDVPFIDDQPYFSIQYQIPSEDFYDLSFWLFRADLNTMTIQSIGDCSQFTLIGDAVDGSGVLLLTNSEYTYSDDIAALTVADYDDPTNENLWQTLIDNVDDGTISLSKDGKSLLIQHVEYESDERPKSDTETYVIVSKYDIESGDRSSFVTLNTSTLLLSNFLSADTTTLIIYERDHAPNTFYIINLNSMKLINTYEIDSYQGISLSALSPTNRLMYVRESTAGIEVFDLETGTVVDAMNIASISDPDDISVRGVRVSPDASFGYINVMDNNVYRLFRFETNEKISAIDAASQWAKRNVTPAHLVIGGIVLAAAAGGGVIAIVAHRRKKAAAAARNGNVPNRNDDFPNGGGSLPNMPAR